MYYITNMHTSDKSQVLNLCVAAQEDLDQLNNHQRSGENEEWNSHLDDEWVHDDGGIRHHFVPVQNDQQERWQDERKWQAREGYWHLFGVNGIGAQRVDDVNNAHCSPHNEVSVTQSLIILAISVSAKMNVNELNELNSNFIAEFNSHR